MWQSVTQKQAEGLQFLLLGFRCIPAFLQSHKAKRMAFLMARSPPWTAAMQSRGDCAFSFRTIRLSFAALETCPFGKKVRYSHGRYQCHCDLPMKLSPIAPSSRV